MDSIHITRLCTLPVTNALYLLLKTSYLIRPTPGSLCPRNPLTGRRYWKLRALPGTHRRWSPSPYVESLHYSCGRTRSKQTVLVTEKNAILGNFTRVTSASFYMGNGFTTLLTIFYVCLRPGFRWLKLSLRTRSWIRDVNVVASSPTDHEFAVVLRPFRRLLSLQWRGRSSLY